MYKKFEVTITFRDKVYGGLPRNKEILQNFIEAKKPELNVEEEAKTLDIVEETEKVWCGFRTDEKGVYLCDYQVKALLRESAKTLKYTKTKKGFLQTLQHGVFIKPRNLHLKKEPDGYEDFCGHVMTMQGKRSILKRCDYVSQATVTFEVWIVDNGDISDDAFTSMLELAQEIGLGSTRSFQNGKFDAYFKKIQ